MFYNFTDPQSFMSEFISSDAVSDTGLNFFVLVFVKLYSLFACFLYALVKFCSVNLGIIFNISCVTA